MNKPVAWMKLDEVLEHFKSVGCGTVYETGGEGRVPVYTHPAELTDEEIHKVWDEVMKTRGQGNDLNKFAKAILRKAQEK